jgi:hypothetical protein
VARAAARHLVRTPWAGFFVERREDGRVWIVGASAGASGGVERTALVDTEPSGGAMDATVELRLTAEDARALNQDLLALVDRYMAKSGDRVVTPNRLLTVASVPIDED